MLTHKFLSEDVELIDHLIMIVNENFEGVKKRVWLPLPRPLSSHFGKISKNEGRIDPHTIQTLIADVSGL